MADIMTPEQRSRCMARIRSKNTRPELLVRRWLHALGYRYTVHDRTLPGKPDIVFSKRFRVIFVDGCFWHSHDCKNGRAEPKTRGAFWSAKRQATVSRDRRVRKELADAGWDYLDVWECELAKPETLDVVASFLGPTKWAKD